MNRALMGSWGRSPPPSLLQRGGFTLNDFDIIEINGSLRLQVLAALKHWRIDAHFTRRSANGGAIALWSPAGDVRARPGCRRRRWNYAISRPATHCDDVRRRRSGVRH
ncbi:hypothetical protein M8494_15630 [Serratia ureilytica]